MKKAIKYLSGMKSRYFMLLACLILLVGATSCSSDEFETNLPEEPQQLSKEELLQKYSKAELIEQALRRMPQTRTNNSRVEMVTIKDTVSLQFKALGDIEIHWENSIRYVTAGSDIEETHIFTDGYPSHYIRIIGPTTAIQSIVIDNNELISLDIKSNENLTNLNCANNHLDALDLSGCKKLGGLDISNNEFISIDLTCLPELLLLHAVNNWLTELDVSANPNIFELYIENNRIRELDLSKNPILFTLEAQNNPLKILRLESEILGYMDVSYTQITDLDLRKCKALWAIILEGTPIERLNNDIIRDTSFISFTELQQLNIAYTSSFTELNLSVNPSVILVDISGSSITRLDISEGQIMYLYASRSKLTDLIWGENDLDNLFEVRIERTPFEKKNWNDIKSFFYNFPDRRTTAPGHLYTYSSSMKEIYSIIGSYNWLINE
ncbi:MAG: hypothetical protein K2I47_03100 [Odoribacter sp.]|nr:hypothetical protein [Odoribacter sp.]